MLQQTAPPSAQHRLSSSDAVPRRRTIRAEVARTDASGATEFDVVASDPVTVLDLLAAIQRAHDPSLGFRYSCRVGMCGTCAVRVNGRSALACRSVIPADEDHVRIAPLAGLPVVRDLIVDTQPFWNAWSRMMPWFVPAEDDARLVPGTPESDLVEGSLGCISCGVCYSACGVTREGSEYVGPAALNRALALIADPRDGAAAERMRRVVGTTGLDGCHYVGACSSACPVGLDPARSIVELRRIRLRGRA